MKCYHYTCYQNTLSILRDGIQTSVVDRVDGEIKPVVWLTTNTQNHLQKWDEGVERLLTEKERHQYFLLNGEMPQKDARWPNKRAVRFTVDIPTDDPKLVRWVDYASEFVDPTYAKKLAQLGGPKQYLEWYLYQGNISPDCVKEMMWCKDAIDNFREENLGSRPYKDAA